MFGISAGEFIVLVVVAALVLGPERLPEYAQGLARLVKELRRMAQGASAQVREELGPDFDDIDWSKLDPRQYDPRRIVREALADSVDLDDPLGLRTLKDKPVSGPTPAQVAAAAQRTQEEAQRNQAAATSANGAERPGAPSAYDPDAT